ncbi:MAG TPA: glycosyltransferase [Vicinamibacterales bacterium]
MVAKPSLMVSFIVPAHNEAQIIAATVTALHASARGAGEPYEILVVDDASTDGTGDLARRAGATVVPATLRHIAAARNAGSRAAKGDKLLFVDADTRVPTDTVRAALDAMRGGAAGGGARVRFDGPLPRYARPGVAVTLRTFRLLNMTVGCFMFCTRAAFDRIGGFDERLFAAEEVAFSLAIKRAGRLVLVEPPAVTSARKFRTHTAFEVARMAAATVIGARRAVAGAPAVVVRRPATRPGVMTGLSA